MATPPEPEGLLEALALDESALGEGPPAPSKTREHHDMHDAKPALDDSEQSILHHPSQAEVVSMHVDPDNADAAADLAGDLGALFLAGATRGEDMSDLAADALDHEFGEPFLVETEFGPDDDAGLGGASVPGEPRRRRRHAA